MKLEQQVCSIEQSKKLKELLKNYETNFYWVELPEGNHLATKKNVDDNLAFDRSLGDNMVAINRVATAWKSIHPAFTVAELGAMIEIDDDKYFLNHSYNNHSGSYETYLSERDEQSETGFVLVNTEEGETEAEARAEMLIYLLEEKHTTPEEVNQRLNQ